MEQVCSDTCSSRQTSATGQALAIQRDTGHRLGQARTLLVLGYALHPGGANAALSHWQQARALFTEIGTPEADHAHALVRACAAAATTGRQTDQHSCWSEWGGGRDRV